MNHREELIRNYVEAYNNFDIDKMTADFDDNIKFENISEETVNMTLNGIVTFKEEAMQSVSLFKERTQKIKSYQHKGNKTEIEIDYLATLAIDLPNGLKAGSELNLKGKSIFKFSENKIIELIDIS